jgi:hypothetical protein
LLHTRSDLEVLPPPPVHRNRRRIRRILGASLLLTLVFALSVLVHPLLSQAAPHAAATTPQSHIGNGPFAPAHPTTQEIAIGNERQALAHEYMNVLHGKEPLARYEQHLLAFMQAHHLGNTARLQSILTHGSAKLRLRFVNGALVPSASPNTGVVGAAQFPEERWSYCADATVSTMVTENSFTWGSPELSYYDPHNGVTYTITYDPFLFTQTYSTALSDEDMLANAPDLLNNPFPDGAGPDDVTRALNAFANGHGGNYNEVSYGDVANNFQDDLINDINQGWDLAGGLIIIQGEATLPGYDGHGDFDHWIPITYYGSINGTPYTYYSDPIYKAPNYGWNIPPPYEYTPTSNMIAILSRFYYVY